jgi:hypothetical protein
MEEPSKFAIHEAARDGRSKKTPAINPLLNPADQAPAAVVESLLNVRLPNSSLRELMICEDETEK